MHIYGEGEQTYSKEYQLRLRGSGFIHLSVWEMNQIQKKTQTKSAQSETGKHITG